MNNDTKPPRPPRRRLRDLTPEEVRRECELLAPYREKVNRRSSALFKQQIAEIEEAESKNDSDASTLTCWERMRNFHPFPEHQDS